MDMTDFFTKSAEFMAADRPDVYTFESAFEDLVATVNSMQERDGSGWTSMADSFILFKHTEDGMTEWQLLRKLSSATIFYEEAGVETRVYGHTKGSGTLKRGVDLPTALDTDY